MINSEVALLLPNSRPYMGNQVTHSKLKVGREQMRFWCPHHHHCERSGVLSLDLQPSGKGFMRTTERLTYAPEA